MPIGYEQQLQKFWKDENLDGIEAVLAALEANQMTLGLLLRLSPEGLAEKFPIFHQQLQLFIIKQLPVDEQLLEHIHMDLPKLLSFSCEGLAEEFPIFHQQLQRFIRQLPVDEQFLKAIGVTSVWKANFTSANYLRVGDLLTAFDNKEQIKKDLKLDEPVLSNAWAFIRRSKEDPVPVSQHAPSCKFRKS